MFSNQEICNVPVPLTQVIIHPLVSLSSTMMKAFVVETWAVFMITMVLPASRRGSGVQELEEGVRIKGFSKTRSVGRVEAKVRLGSCKELFLSSLSDNDAWQSSSTLTIKVLIARTLIRISVIGQRVVTQMRKARVSK